MKSSHQTIFPLGKNGLFGIRFRTENYWARIMNKRVVSKRALPEGWQEVQLGDVCQVNRGGSPRPIQDYLTCDQKGINWLRIGDVSSQSKYIFETKEKIIPAGLKKSVLVKEGDFILSNSMSYGRPYIMKVESWIHDGCFNADGYSSEYP